MTHPKITLALLFLVVLMTAIAALPGRSGSDVHMAEALAEQKQTDKNLTSLTYHKAECLEDAVPSRLSSFSVSSKDKAAEMRAADFFPNFFSKFSIINYLSSVPLLCRPRQRSVNIHGP